MTAATPKKSKKRRAPAKETAKPKTANPMKGRGKSKQPNRDKAYHVVSNDAWEVLKKPTLEAEVVSFIEEYAAKDYSDIDNPAVVLSRLRTLYNGYGTAIDQAGRIIKGALTKYGIQCGMLLNIERKLLQHNIGHLLGKGCDERSDLLDVGSRQNFEID